MPYTLLAIPGTADGPTARPAQPHGRSRKDSPVVGIQQITQVTKARQ